MEDKLNALLNEPTVKGLPNYKELLRKYKPNHDITEFLGINIFDAPSSNKKILNLAKKMSNEITTASGYRATAATTASGSRATAATTATATPTKPVDKKPLIQKKLYVPDLLERIQIDGELFYLYKGNIYKEDENKTSASLLCSLEKFYRDRGASTCDLLPIDSYFYKAIDTTKDSKDIYSLRGAIAKVVGIYEDGELKLYE